MNAFELYKIRMKQRFNLVCNVNAYELKGDHRLAFEALVKQLQTQAKATVYLVFDDRELSPNYFKYDKSFSSIICKFMMDHGYTVSSFRDFSGRDDIIEIQATVNEELMGKFAALGYK